MALVPQLANNRANKNSYDIITAVNIALYELTIVTIIMMIMLIMMMMMMIMLIMLMMMMIII